MTSVNFVRQTQHINGEACTNQHHPRPRHASALLHPDSNLPSPSSPLVLRPQGKQPHRNVTAAEAPFRSSCVDMQYRAGRRQQAVTCSAQINAATAVAEVPKDMQTPQEVASVFQKLQNGSDIRGIAIAGPLMPF